MEVRKLCEIGFRLSVISRNLNCFMIFVYGHGRKKDVFLRELFSFYGQKWLQGRIAKNQVKQGVLRNTALLDGFLNNEIT